MIVDLTLSDTQVWGIALACIMMCLDVVVGFVAAVINKEVSSTKMREGLLHKVLMLLLIIACLAVELSASHIGQLPYDIPTCEVVCVYIVVMELMSMRENIADAYPGFSDMPLGKLFDFDCEEKEK